MSLLVYPSLLETGVENMASDWWLMQQAVNVSLPLFRHYEWAKPEISFWIWAKMAMG